MRVLVTGGTGFIGSEVVRLLLEAGDRVKVFSRSRDLRPLFTGDLEVVHGDLENARSLIAALDGIDVFYHVGEIKNSSKAASEKNVKLMEEMLREVKAKGVKRIIFVSSITVSGVPLDIPADEDTAPRIVLNDHYTDCKRRSENLLIDHAGNVEYAILRPAPVYGPGSRYLGRLIDALASLGSVGVPFPGNGENLAPLVHIRDLGQAIVRAGKEPAAAGQIFNVSDGTRHSWREFLQRIVEALGKRLRILPLPRLVLQLAALPVDLLSGFFGVSLDPLGYITYFSEDIFFENSKAKALLNWEPRHFLPEGVKDMIDFYVQRNTS
jgi:nucleoside-diphosphate-sugar epimerase